MKKVVFMVINMNVGGTEKALLNMLAELPKTEYDVTILMLEKYGDFLEHIPKDVYIQYLSEYKKIKDILNKPRLWMVINLLKRKRFAEALSLLCIHILTKFTNDTTLLFRYLLKEYPVIDKSYDAAVAYAGPMDFITYYVLNKIKAKKKVQWVHFDVTKIGFNKKFVSKNYCKFNKVFVVSDEGKSKLINMFPNLKDKTEKFTNIVSSALINKMADEGIGFKDNFAGVRILTVGRLSKEKGQDLTIPILARLKQEGYNIRWYCIGEGSARSEYEKIIYEYDVRGDYILLGSNPNPYPFMKECDIYVQSSRHEGYCITLSEARCFENPIISTNFTGAAEQIANGENGLIAECSEEHLYNSVKRILDDEELRNRIKKNLRNEKVDTTKEIEKLYEITA